MVSASEFIKSFSPHQYPYQLTNRIHIQANACFLLQLDRLCPSERKLGDNSTSVLHDGYQAFRGKVIANNPTAINPNTRGHHLSGTLLPVVFTLLAFTIKHFKMQPRRIQPSQNYLKPIVTTKKYSASWSASSSSSKAMASMV